VGYVVEVFDVHLEAGKRLVSGFEVAEVAFSAVFFLSDPGLAVLADDPGDGVDAPGEVEFFLETFSPESGEAAAELDNHGFGLWRELMGAVMGSPAAIEESFRTFRLETIPPFPNRGRGSFE
jgi:hypothetical protein